MSDYELKFSAAMEELASAGVQKSAHATGALHLAKALGFKPRPPLYASVLSNTISLGAIFAIVWGLLMYVFAWGASNVPIYVALGAAIIAGLLFGLLMAFFFRFVRRRKKLTCWDDL